MAETSLTSNLSSSRSVGAKETDLTSNLSLHSGEEWSLLYIIQGSYISVSSHTHTHCWRMQGVELRLHTFLTSVVDKAELSRS